MNVQFRLTSAKLKGNELVLNFEDVTPFRLHNMVQRVLETACKGKENVSITLKLFFNDKEGEDGHKEV